jgi:hypothetical protein
LEKGAVAAGNKQTVPAAAATVALNSATAMICGKTICGKTICGKTICGKQFRGKSWLTNIMSR